MAIHHVALKALLKHPQPWKRFYNKSHKFMGLSLLVTRQPLQSMRADILNKKGFGPAAH